MKQIVTYKGDLTRRMWNYLMRQNRYTASSKATTVKTSRLASGQSSVITNKND